MVNYKIFHGFEEIYPENVKGTDSWYYGQLTPCSEPSEVITYNGNYPGTKLYLISYPSGEVFEPFPQEKDVFLEIPVYERASDSFGILRYDFKNNIMQATQYFPNTGELQILAEFPISTLGDLINVRMIVSPFAVVKYDFIDETVDFLWPKKIRFSYEEHETLDFQFGDKFYCFKWIEDPNYREEVIVRDAKNGNILNRIPGYVRVMPNGEFWIMTK